VETVRPSVLATGTLRLTLQASSDFHETHSYWTFYAVQKKKTWSPNSAPPWSVLNSLWTQRYLYRQWLWQCLAARQTAVLGNAGNWYSVETTNDSQVLWEVTAVCLSVRRNTLDIDYTKTQLGWGQPPPRPPSPSVLPYGEPACTSGTWCMLYVGRRTGCDGSLLRETHRMLPQYQTVSHCVTRHTEAYQIVGGRDGHSLQHVWHRKIMRTGF
jgi:hypothetical protein